MPAARGISAFACVVALAACGGSGAPSTSTHSPAGTQHHNPATRPALRGLTVSHLGTLPAAVQDPAVAALPDGRVALLGGLDSSQSSTDAVTVLDGGSSTPHGTLPNAQHDAQAAALGSSVYVFGGGQFSEYDHILRYDPATATTAPAGALPTPASDVAVTWIGNTAYIVGGYTGTSFLDTILAWSPGGAPRVVAHLPAGVRYAAAAPANGKVIIVGGTLTGGPSDQILSFDPASGTVSPLGHLPVPLTHASAAFIDGRIIVVGGRRQLDGDQTTAVLAINPRTGAVAVAGRLPEPLSDAAVAASRGRIVVAGGDDGNGPQSSILALTPRP